MASKTRKNPNVKDTEREKYLIKRIFEERAAAEEIWKWRGSKTPEEKSADYIKDKKPDDHITYRILKPVIHGLKYGIKYYPTTPEEKYLEMIGMNLLRQKISAARRDERLGYVSIGTGIIHENPHTKDLENIVCDMATIQPRGSKKKSEILALWEENRNQVQTTLKEGTDLTVKNALKSKEEREKLLRQEMERRRKRKNSEKED